MFRFPLTPATAPALPIGRALLMLGLACMLPLALAALLLFDQLVRTDSAAMRAAVGERAGTLAAAVEREVGSSGGARATRLARTLAAQQLPAGWRVAILDPAATVAVRSADGPALVSAAALADLRARLLLYGDGAATALTVDGVEVLAMTRTAGASGWSVAVAVPAAELRATLWRRLAPLAIGTLAAVAAGALAAALIGRRIAGALQALVTLAAPPAASVSGVAAPVLQLAEARAVGAALDAARQAMAQLRAGLHASEQRLELATESTGFGIWVRQLATAEIWASARWRSLFGFGPAAVITLDEVLTRVHPDDRASVRAALTDVAGRGSYDIEYRLLLPGGAVRWIASRGRIDRDDDGRPIAVMGISSDVSARKLAELALQKKQNEVFHLSRVAVLGELSGALAHEINQPLTAILSNAQAAQRLIGRTPPPLADIGDILADIVAEDRRAAEIIRRLRGLLRNSETVREVIDFDAVTGDVLGLLRNDLLNRDIRVEAAVGPALPVVLGDRVQLQQLLINLVVNGCDAIATSAASHRAINVAAQAAGAGWVELTVHDGGPGLADPRSERIFEPFHTTKADGMGLGLAICRKIVSAHGGSMRAANHRDGGAIFHVLLPACHD